jgi:hypothetical protein
MLVKRSLTLMGLLMLAAALCITATARSFRRTQAAEKILPVVEEKYTSFDTAAYILIEQNGYVAVFSSNPRQLLEITDIPVSTLPAADRTQLQTGIAAKGRYELLTLLEDLNS